MKRCPTGHLLEKLPRSLEDSGDQPLVCHFAETEAGQLELAQKSAGAPCKLTPVPKTDLRRIFWELVQGIHSSKPIFDVFAHVENSPFQGFSLFPIIFYHPLALFLSRDLRFFCHYSSTSYEQALFGAASGWDLFY